MISNGVHKAWNFMREKWILHVIKCSKDSNLSAFDILIKSYYMARMWYGSRRSLNF